LTWGVLVTEQGRQEEIVDQLKKRCVEHFFPRSKRTVRRKGVRHCLIEPLLFNYIPVTLTEKIWSIRGVLDVLGPACPKQIEDLRRRCDGDGIITIRFKPGDSVRAHSGFYSLVVGKYLGLLPDQREAAVFSVFGSMRSVSFREGDLVAA
jgi:hypothetical protein